jgi:hypothetical protein
MDLGAANVGLGDLGDKAAGWRLLGDLEFVELDLMRAGNKGDFSFHLDTPSGLGPRIGDRFIVMLDVARRECNRNAGHGFGDADA